MPVTAHQINRGEPYTVTMARPHIVGITCISLSICCRKPKSLDVVHSSIDIQLMRKNAYCVAILSGEIVFDESKS